jgi:hypothetical protein
MTKAILHQIVTDNTRAYLDMEDGRGVWSGCKMDVQAAISIADEYEKVHRVYQRNWNNISGSLHDP